MSSESSELWLIEVSIDISAMHAIVVEALIARDYLVIHPEQRGIYELFYDERLRANVVN